MRSVAPARVRAGDVILVRYPAVPNSRWLLVDHASEHGAPHVWSGRWAFGADAGEWTIVKATADDYTVKDRLDAWRDRERLEALRRSAHV